MVLMEVLPQNQWTRYSCYDVDWKTSRKTSKNFLGLMWRIYKFLYIIVRARSVNIVLKCAQKFRKPEA